MVAREEGDERKKKATKAKRPRVKPTCSQEQRAKNKEQRRVEEPRGHIANMTGLYRNQYLPEAKGCPAWPGLE